MYQFRLFKEYLKSFNSIKELIIKVSGIALLCLSYVWQIIYFNKHMLNFLDSDMSSEMVLSHQLFKEGAILSKNWYYSTELRVLNNQLIFAPLFAVFKSWKHVRIVGTALLLLILLASFLYLCKQLDIKFSEFYALLLLMPLTPDYFLVVLRGVYYVPHISISFITIGLFIKILKRYVQRKRTSIKILLIISIAFLAGLGGLRQLLILYLPLFITTLLIVMLENPQILEKETVFRRILKSREFILSACMLISSFCGYIVNSKILSKLYSFSNFNEIEFSQVHFDKLESVINGWMQAIGYRSNGSLFSKALVINALFASVILVVIYTISKLLKNMQTYPNTSLVILFVCVSIAVLTFLYLFTDMEYLLRYLLPVSIWFIPIIAIFSGLIRSEKQRYLLILSVIFYFVIVSKTFYYSGAQTDQQVNYNGEFDTIANILTEDGYTEGYASFWNSSILTELSNGKIEVWCYGDTNKKIKTRKIFKWLQLKSHEENKPHGKIFVILGTSELEFNPSILNVTDIIYKSDKFTVFGFKDMNALNSLN